MKRQLIHITIIFLLLTSCKSSTPAYKYRELARAGVALGMDISFIWNPQDGWVSLTVMEAAASTGQIVPGSPIASIRKSTA